MPKLPPKRLLLKLGTQCNLGCAHCHQHQMAMAEHPRLLDWIRTQKFDRITFSGGEPMLYFPKIREIMEALGTGITYRIVSNGTILTEEMVEFLNRYPVIFAVSYDGKHSGRDDSLPILWAQIRKLRGFSGFSCVMSDPRTTIRQICEDLGKLVRREKLPLPGYIPELQKIGFVHQTADAQNVLFTKAVADRYIWGVLGQAQTAMALMLADDRFTGVAVNFLGTWVKRRDYITHGVLCCNPSMVNLNLDGTFSLCPYGDKKIGDIDSGIDWDFVDTFVPGRCKRCNFRGICACACIANTTRHECHIHKTLAKEIKILAEKYGISKKLKDFF